MAEWSLGRERRRRIFVRRRCTPRSLHKSIHNNCSTLFMAGNKCVYVRTRVRMNKAVASLMSQVGGENKGRNVLLRRRRRIRLMREGDMSIIFTARLTQVLFFCYFCCCCCCCCLRLLRELLCSSSSPLLPSSWSGEERKKRDGGGG